MTAAQNSESAPATIWRELDEWAQDFSPWQRFVLTIAVRSRVLSDDQIEQAYRLFLYDNGLAAAPDPAIAVSPDLTGRPAEAAAAPMWLTSIRDLYAVNALPDGAELTFSPALTVVYGRNGAGKSGFARVLSNACFSRAHNAILSNVYDEGPRRVPRATIVIADGTQQEIAIVVDSATEHSDLKRIAIFDSRVAHAHLVEANSLEFKPIGFDVFPEMARVYARLSERLSADIQQRNRENVIIKSFIAPESTVSQFVAMLNADTDIDELHRLANFGAVENARLNEVQRQIQDLRSKGVADAIQQLGAAKRDLELLQSRLTESGAPLSETSCAAYRAQLAGFAAKARVAATEGAETFKEEFLRGVGTEEWENFLAAAHALALVEHESYPHDEDYCLMCHRRLDPASVALIRRYWGFLASEARREVEEASAQLDQSVQALKALRLDFFSADMTAYEHLMRLNPPLASKIQQLVAAMDEYRTAIVTTLENSHGDIGSQAFVDVAGELAALISQVEADIDRLKKQDVEDTIKTLERERVVLRHRQVLSQIVSEVENYISDLAWARQAAGAPKHSLSPRALTDKESELFAKVVASEYKERFSRECAALDCKLPVELRTQGQRGQTIQSLILKGGHKPADVLSEGEQRAIALADFLTEVAINPANSGIVLDDPVTSQDHQRKDLIACRLVREAKNRQVIIFTHDLVFLTMLANASNDDNVEMLTHWIERDGNGRPGQISLDDSPATTPQYRNTKKAKKTLDEAKAASGSERVRLVQRGMGELRRTIEEIIPQFLLKEVVKRWTDRILVTSLKKVKWDDLLINEIVDAYEQLSAYIEGHSHTEERASAPPEPQQLEEMISVVDNLIRRARADRPRQSAAS